MINALQNGVRKKSKVKIRCRNARFVEIAQHYILCPAWEWVRFLGPTSCEIMKIAQIRQTPIVQKVN